MDWIQQNKMGVAIALGIGTTGLIWSQRRRRSSIHEDILNEEFEPGSIRPQLDQSQTKPIQSQQLQSPVSPPPVASSSSSSHSSEASKPASKTSSNHAPSSASVPSTKSSSSKKSLNAGKAKALASLRGSPKTKPSDKVPLPPPPSSLSPSTSSAPSSSPTSSSSSSKSDHHSSPRRGSKSSTALSAFSFIDPGHMFGRLAWLAVAGGQLATYTTYLSLQQRANDARLFRYERRDLLSTLYQMKRAFTVYPGCPAVNWLRAPLFAARPLQFLHQLASVGFNGLEFMQRFGGLHFIVMFFGSTLLGYSVEAFQHWITFRSLETLELSGSMCSIAALEAAHHVNTAADDIIEANDFDGDDGMSTYASLFGTAMAQVALSLLGSFAFSKLSTSLARTGDSSAVKLTVPADTLPPSRDQPMGSLLGWFTESIVSDLQFVTPSILPALASALFGTLYSINLLRNRQSNKNRK